MAHEIYQSLDTMIRIDKGVTQICLSAWTVMPLSKIVRVREKFKRFKKKEILKDSKKKEILKPVTQAMVSLKNSKKFLEFFRIF